MLRLICLGTILFSAGSSGCGDGGDVTGAGGTTIFEPGPTCIAFCAKGIGECEAFAFDEASCRQGCEENLAEESAKSEACGNAVEAVFDCAAELDCQGFEEFRDRVPLDDYPCRSDVIVVDAACPQN